MKPFETDILKLRADELNYTLCMFVKEVKKPNGDAYAPDSILYLTLGIQVGYLNIYKDVILNLNVLCLVLALLISVVLVCVVFPLCAHFFFSKYFIATNPLSKETHLLKSVYSMILVIEIISFLY